MDEPTLRMIAAESFDAFNSGGRHVQSFSVRHPGFTLDEASGDGVCTHCAWRAVSNHSGARSAYKSKDVA